MSKDFKIPRSEQEKSDSTPSYIKDILKSHRRSIESRLSTKPLSETLPGKVKSISEEVQKDMSAEDCCVLLRGLAYNEPNRVISRNYFRVNSGIKESTWNRYFGTFHEFKRQAGIVLSRGAHRLEKHIAKHASADHYRAMSDTTKGLDKKYLKPNSKRFQSTLIFTDVHDVSCDPFCLRVLLDTARRASGIITKVVLGGDIFDLSEFSRFNQDPREWDVIGKIKFVHKNILKRLRELLPNAEFTFVVGNHESVNTDTEILCDNGWVQADKITKNHAVASYDTKGIVSYNKPIALSEKSGVEMLSVKGDLSDELISDKHRIDIDNLIQPASKFIGEKISCNRIKYATNNKQNGISLNNDRIRLITWVVTDATIRREKLKDGSESKKSRVQWKLSKPRKIKALKLLLEKMGIAFTFRAATKSGLNKLQPYYIRVYGEESLRIWNYLKGKKQFPIEWKNLNSSQLNVLIDTLSITDGFKIWNHTFLSTTNKSDVEVIQFACIMNGIPCKYSIKDNGSGFDNGKRQYNLSIFNKGLSNRRKVAISKAGIGNVVSITTKDDTLITRRNGKVSFTGNSRLLYHLADATPAMKVILSDLHGFDIPKLLGLNEFEINYIGRANLSASSWNKRDHNKELEKNFYIVHDCFLVHHFPTGMKKNMPGCHGHHHKFKAWSFDSPIFGSYNWYQLGCMCVRDASYTDADPWSNGFALLHTDVQNKRSSFEYIDIKDHVYVGGVPYIRRKSEAIDA